MIEETWRDIQFALRRLISQPLVTFSALLTLALGIGANAAIFSVIYGVLLKPLPYPESDRLVVIWETNPEGGLPRFTVSAPNFIDWRGQSESFDALAAVAPRRMSLASAGEEPEILSAARVSADFWKVFGTAPFQGRAFGATEDRPGGGQVAVISHGLWQRRFGGDPGILGRTIMLDGQSYPVVGIAPERFGAPDETEVWVPLALNMAQEGRGSHYLQVFGRLAQGREPERAEAELVRIAANLAQEYPDTNQGWGIDLIPLHENAVEDVRSSLLVLFAAVTAVLLMACINVANLLLVQFLAREGEIAVRIALGVSRLRLVRQLMTEGMVLSLLGGALGLLVAFWGGRLLTVSLPDLPRTNEVGLSSEVLVFALVVSLAAGFLVGILPAFQSLGQHQYYETLRQGRTGTGRRGMRTRAALVAAEMAFAVVLLIGAGLLIRSLYQLRSVDPGFHSQGIMTLRFALPEVKYRESERKKAFYEELSARLASLPGVESAGLSFPLPLDGSYYVLSYGLPGRGGSEAEQSAQSADIRTVSPGFFRTISVPVLGGRVFQDGDRSGAQPVVVVNEVLADREWPGQDPIGRRLTFDDPTSPDAEWLTVIGVVGNLRHKSLSQVPGAEIYRSQFQSPTRSASVVVRTNGDPLLLSGAVRREIHAMDPHLAVWQIQTMDEIVQGSLSQTRSSGLICGIFAAMALILAAVGVYGVSSYSASQRAREIGIRMALGAQRGDVVGLMIRRGSGMILLGTGLGLALAFVVVRSLSSLVYGVDPFDPWTFTAVTVTLVLVGLVANYLPAQRIAQTDPLLALKRE